MNQIVIVFVPTGAAKDDLQAVLREHFASLEMGVAPVEAKAVQPESGDMDEWPLWTWFLPNPYPSRK